MVVSPLVLRGLLTATMVVGSAGVATAVSRSGSDVTVAVHAGVPDGNNDLATSTSVLVTLPVTVSTVTLPAVTLPTFPHLPHLPRVPAPVEPATVTTRHPRAPTCGDPSGSGGLGASHTFGNGPVSLVISVYPCPTYDSDGYTQLNVEVHGPDPVVAVHFDYGDGSVVDDHIAHWGCDPKRPDPFYVNPPNHTYTSPGTYHVAAAVTTGTCAPDTTGEPPGDRTTAATIDAVRIAGPRPR